MFPSKREKKDIKRRQVSIIRQEQSPTVLQQHHHHPIKPALVAVDDSDCTDPKVQSQTETPLRNSSDQGNSTSRQAPITAENVARYARRDSSEFQHVDEDELRRKPVHQLTAEEKKVKRIMANRRSARESHKRRKKHMADIQERLELLEEENRELQDQNSTLLEEVKELRALVASYRDGDEKHESITMPPVRLDTTASKFERKIQPEPMTDVSAVTDAKVASESRSDPVRTGPLPRAGPCSEAEAPAVSALDPGLAPPEPKEDLQRQIELLQLRNSMMQQQRSTAPIPSNVAVLRGSNRMLEEILRSVTLAPQRGPGGNDLASALAFAAAAEEREREQQSVAAFTAAGLDIVTATLLARRQSQLGTPSTMAAQPGVTNQMSTGSFLYSSLLADQRLVAPSTTTSNTQGQVARMLQEGRAAAASSGVRRMPSQIEGRPQQNVSVVTLLNPRSEGALREKGSRDQKSQQ